MMEADQKEEAETVHTSLLSFRVEPSQGNYIIPMTWFKRWKAFISFTKHVPEASADHEDCLDEELDFRLGPGPIMDESLYEQPDFKTFPEIL